MYEDEPQDKVHDVLSRGDLRRPPARPAGDRPRRGDLVADASTRSPHYHDARYTPASDRRRGRRQPRARGDRASWRERALRRPAARAERRARARRPSAGRRAIGASTRRTPSSTTSASAGPASRATTSAASRCRCSTRCSAARRRRASSRRCARSAASRTRSTRGRASTATPARSASTSARARTTSPRRWSVIGTELERLQQEAVTDEELTRAREHVKGRIVLSMESTGEPHAPARALGPDGDAAALARRDDRAARRGRRRADPGAGARVLRAGVAVRRRDRAGRGSLPRRARRQRRAGRGVLL